MIKLNANQIAFIEARLQQEDLTYQPLQEELLDHLCCLAEERMHAGYPFSKAVDLSFEHFEKEEFKMLEQKAKIYSSSKKQKMKSLSLFVLAISLSLPTLFFIHSQDPPSKSPLKGEFKITSHFGMRNHPITKQKKMHKGMDFAAPLGTPVYATADGVVDLAEYNKAYGHHIIIKHDDQFSTLYSQLHEIGVKPGQEVKKGRMIGKVGNSGLSTAPHLHYEVIRDGENVDPKNFLKP